MIKGNFFTHKINIILLGCQEKPVYVDLIMHMVAVKA
jgi:hypothetical protein